MRPLPSTLGLVIHHDADAVSDIRLRKGAEALGKADSATDALLQLSQLVRKTSCRLLLNDHSEEQTAQTVFIRKAQFNERVCAFAVCPVKEHTRFYFR